MNNREWEIKNIDAEAYEVSGKVVRPDLVLVEGGLRQQVAAIDETGVVRRSESTIPFSRQVRMAGVLPGHTVRVETQVLNPKPRQGANIVESTLLTLHIAVEAENGLIAVETEEFIVSAPKPKNHPDVPTSTQERKAPEETDLRVELEREYAERYEAERMELERELRDAYQYDLRMHLEQLQAAMEDELTRRWKQQLSKHQTRSGFRTSVEFGSA